MVFGRSIWTLGGLQGVHTGRGGPHTRRGGVQAVPRGAERRCEGGRERGGLWGSAVPPTSPPVIILSVVELLVILLLIFLRKRILIAIALIKEAGRWAPPLPPPK